MVVGVGQRAAGWAHESSNNPYGQRPHGGSSPPRSKIGCEPQYGTLWYDCVGAYARSEDI